MIQIEKTKKSIECRMYWKNIVIEKLIDPILTEFYFIYYKTLCFCKFTFTKVRLCFYYLHNANKKVYEFTICFMQRKMYMHYNV
jgi:hypothetical protein